MRLINSVGIVGGLTLIARVFGYLRDMLIANIMGAGWLTDVFFVAFRIPNFLRRIFAEGAFSAAFVPLFASTLEREGKESARHMAAECQSVMLVVLALLTIAALVFMEPIMWLFTPGFRDDPAKFELSVALTRITFPYLIFISITALYGGVLNSMKRFAAFAAVSIFLNISLIAALWLLHRTLPTPAHALAYGVPVAGIAQVLWMLFFLSRNNILIPLLPPRITTNVKRLFDTMLPAILGASVAQVNLLVDTIIASYVENAVSYIYFADRVSQLPLSVIGVALGTVLLPTLAAQIHSGREAESNHTLNRGLEMALLLTLPAACALLTLGYGIISVLFEHGEFTKEAAVATTHALMAAALGLPAFVMVKVLVPAFYARHDTKTPVRIALVCIVVNIVLNLLLMNHLKHVGIVLATSLASWLNTLLLAWNLKKRTAWRLDDRLKMKLRGTAVSSLIMIIVLEVSQGLLYHFDKGSKTEDTLMLGVYIAAGLIALGATLIFTRALDIREVQGYLAESKARLRMRKK